MGARVTRSTTHAIIPQLTVINLLQNVRNAISRQMQIVTRMRPSEENERVRPVWLANGHGEKLCSGVKRWTSTAYVSSRSDHAHAPKWKPDVAKGKRESKTGKLESVFQGSCSAQRCDPGSTERNPPERFRAPPALLA